MGISQVKRNLLSLIKKWMIRLNLKSNFHKIESYFFNDIEDKIQSPAYSSHIALRRRQRSESSGSPLFPPFSYPLLPR